jgi:hypothetical protein
VSPASRQEEPFPRPIPNPGTVFVNDRVSFQTEEKQRVVLVHGIIFSHYSIDDRSAEAYAMVQLFESGYADQNDIANCFGYSARSLRRYQERLKVGGLSALARPEGRPSGSPSVQRTTRSGGCQLSFAAGQPSHYNCSSQQDYNSDHAPLRFTKSKKIQNGSQHHESC